MEAVKKFMNKLFNLVMNNVWTDCQHEAHKRKSDRGYHTICAPELGGCGAKFGRDIEQ